MKSIIKIAFVFVVSFLCFNQGMNDLASSHLTRTNAVMIIAPILLVMLVFIKEIFKLSEEAEDKSEDKTL